MARAGRYGPEAGRVALVAVHVPVKPELLALRSMLGPGVHQFVEFARAIDQVGSGVPDALWHSNTDAVRPEPASREPVKRGGPKGRTDSTSPS